MYHMSTKSQIIRLSNDMNNIRMNKRILLKINEEIEKKKLTKIYLLKKYKKKSEFSSLLFDLTHISQMICINVVSLDSL